MKEKASMYERRFQNVLAHDSLVEDINQLPLYVDPAVPVLSSSNIKSPESSSKDVQRSLSQASCSRFVLLYSVPQQVFASSSQTERSGLDGGRQHIPPLGSNITKELKR